MRKKYQLALGGFFLISFLNAATISSSSTKSNPSPLIEAQTDFTISGYVTEAESGEQLLGVSIYVNRIKVGTTTNDYGFYSLTLPEGLHSLTVSYLGYATRTEEIDLRTNKTLNISLRPSAENLNEVVVTSDQLQNETKVTQMSTIKLNPADVADVPALLGEKDVLKTLQLLPGIQGGTEGSAGLFVRGGTPDQNLIILDDAVVYNSNHLFGFFSVFSGDAIKSIEAFKGGFPARFGGRLSSVIKIDMKDGNKEKFTGKANIGLISSSLVLEGPINKGKTSFIFSGRRTYIDALVRPFLNKEEGTGGYYFGDLNFKIHHIFDDKNRLYWSNYLGRDQFSSKFESDIDQDQSRLGWGNITSTLRWNHKFNNKFFSNTSLIFSNYKFNVAVENTFRGVKNTFRTSSGIDDFSLKTDFNYYPNTNHAVRFGATATLHNFTPQRLTIVEPGIRDTNLNQKLNSLETAVFIEDDWKISDKLRIAPGLRISHFNFENTNYFNPEPRLGISYNPKPDLALKASYANMNQYIHLLSSSGIGLPTDLWISSTDRIKPQRAEQFSVGLAKSFNKGYSLSVEGYYKKLDDIIAYKEGASFLSLDNLESGKEIDFQDDITSGQGWAYGTEILFRKQTGAFTGWLGYTLAWSQRQFDELNLGKKFNARYDRRHDIELVGIYKPSPKMTLSATWVFATGINYTLPNLQRLPLNDDFPITTGFGNFNPNLFPPIPTEDFATQRNNFRGESTHRLDLGIQFHKTTKRNWKRTWGISLYNTYSRKNPFIYTVSDNDIDTNGDEIIDFQGTALERTAILIFIPSITYTLKF